MNKILISLLLLTLSAPGVVAADRIAKSDVLSLGQCLGLAIKNNPAISAARSGVLQADSRIGLARSGYYPQLNLQSGYSRVGVHSETLQSTSNNAYANTVNLQQTLFDFGKTGAQVDISKLHKEAAESDVRDITASVIYSVKEAYYAFVKARMSLKVALETVNQFEQHYEIARMFFETGKSSKIDVTSAEVNLSNARIQLLSAQNTLRLSRLTLNRAMGIISTPEYDVQEEFEPETPGISFEDALARAYENRPDLLAAIRKKEALEKNISLQKKGYFPVLAGSAGYGYTGNELSQMNHSWNAGVTLTFPLFSGFSTRYAVKEAGASVEAARANEDALLQRIHLEVQSAYLNRKEALERISAGRIIVRQAEESLELARGRYATGVGSSIEITDAMIQLNNAKMTYIGALSDFSIAQASLEKAIGVHP